MNITIDMVTGEVVNNDDVIVISDRRTGDVPEARENTDCSACETELQIREVEIETEAPVSIPVDITGKDIETFLNDMN
jgi:hypothetical protein